MRRPTRTSRTRLSRRLAALALAVPVLVSASGIAPPAAARAQAEAREIRPGQPPVEREIKADEIHSYRLPVAAGQFLHAVVEQKGVDVVVALLAGDGRQLLEVDSPNGSRGQEPVLFVAPADGVYRLTVRALEKTAAGRYQLRLVALRAVTADDRKRMLAEKTFAEGEQVVSRVMSRGAAGEVPAAVRKFEEALPLWRELGDRAREENTLFHLSNLYRIYGPALGRAGKAAEYARALAALSRGQGRRNEALALNDSGRAADVRGEPRKALENYRAALAVWREVGDAEGEARTLINIGAAYHALGEPEKALEHFDRALGLSRQTGDRRGQAHALNNRGLLRYSFDEQPMALRDFAAARGLYREASDLTGEALALSNLGLVYNATARRREALEHFTQALELSLAAGDTRGEALALTNAAALRHDLGESHEALGHFARALALWEQLGERKLFADTLGNVATVRLALGQTAEALELYGRSLAESRALGSLLGEASALLGLARTHRARGELGRARENAAAMLAAIESTRARVSGRELRDTHLSLTRHCYEEYIGLQMELHRRHPDAGHDGEALATSERARARGLLDMLRESSADIRRGVEPALLGAERDLRERLSRKAEFYARLLGGAGTPEEARAAAAEVEELTAEFQKVQARIRETSPQYAALTQPATLDLAGIRRVLDPDTLLLEYAVGEERSFAWAVTQESITSFELPGHKAIADAVRRAYLPMTARNLREKFETAEERGARLAEADEEYAEAARALGRMLLGPVAARLTKRRLLVVADGALHFLPFAALPVPQAGGAAPGRPAAAPQLLVAGHEVVNLPSASALAVLRGEQAGRGVPAKTIAVFADPVFNAGDERVRGARAKGPKGVRRPRAAAAPPGGDRDAAGRAEMSVRRLPFTRREAEAILSLVPAGERAPFLDFDANRAAATDASLADYRYLHFATHGWLNSDDRRLSAVLLSLVDERGEPRDGLLWAHEVYNLKLPAELVVLSGCQTGLGREMRGEGLLGLTRGFMYAGAARVMVSLWDVNDEATSELMSRFYRAMLGPQRLSPAAALREAQASILKDEKLSRWHAPYYWAGFVLHGEPR